MFYVLRQWSQGRLSGITSHLERHSLPFVVLEAWQMPEWPTLQQGDAIIALGGPSSVCGPLEPFLERQCTFLDSARSRHIPILGICLSHQLLGRMDGGEVEPGTPEFGVCPVYLTGDGRHHWLFEGLPPRLAVFQNHGDRITTFTRRLLASSATCPVQAVAWDNTTVSVQFHPELLIPHIESTLDRNPIHVARTGLSRGQTLDRLPPTYPEYTRRFFDNFFLRAGAIQVSAAA